MPKFVFAFESLKKLRSNKLLLARKEQMEVDGRLRALLDEHRLATIMRADLFDDRDLAASSGNPASLLHLSMDMLETQTLKIRLLEKKILAAQGESERHGNWVAHLGRELKIVEKLEENKRKVHDHELQLREKRQADRWVAERWAMNLSKQDDGDELNDASNISSSNSSMAQGGSKT